MRPSPKHAAFWLKSSPGPTNGAPPRSEAWGLLEFFLQDLQRCDSLGRQLRLVLETVHQGVGADLVFICSLGSGDLLEVLGEPRPAVAWCRSFIERLLREAPGVEGQLLRSVLPEHAGNGSGPAPCSAALVQLSKSRSTWLAALSYTPGRHFQPDDIRLMALLRRMLLQHSQQTQAGEQLKDTLFGLVRCLTAARDARNPHTRRHSERVARLAVRLGRQMVLPESMLGDLYLGGLLHDVGKIGMDDTVLCKPAALTAEEMGHVQRHTLLGDEIVAQVPQLAHLRPMVRHHHERYDGKGYPDGLAGESIPLLARILALADGFDAMNSDRPYRRALAPERIEAILTEGAGRQWDPQLLRHFQACRRELYTISRKQP